MIKLLKTLKPFIANAKDKKEKYCSTCSNVATQEATFDVGEGVTVIEKYCDVCAKKIK